MPFFAKLFGEGRRADFADTVNKSVYRIAAASMLVTALMIPAALPFVDLAFRRGRFTFSDSLSTSVYFAWFSLSLALWSAQALYARGFYAAGNTLTPMVASSVITVASLPVYAAMFRKFRDADTPGNGVGHRYPHAHCYPRTAPGSRSPRRSSASVWSA